MRIRRFEAEDTAGLISLYREAVRRIGPVAYTPEQIAAWSVYPQDHDEFRRRLARGFTLVVEEAGALKAFAGLEPEGFVAFVYTSADCCRKGVGSVLLAGLERHAAACGITMLRTEASLISHRFFLKHGYRVEKMLHLVHFGVPMDWYCMEKSLAAPEMRPRFS